MADVLRRPLEVGRRDPPLVTAVVFAVSSLLTTTLAVAPLPIGVQSFPVQVQRYIQLGADTTQDSPQTLRPDAQRPVGTQSTLQPDRIRPVVDTSRGTALVLRSNGVTPFFNSQIFAPDGSQRLVLPADTTADTPKALTADKQAPVSNPQIFAPDPIRPVVDSSRGTAKALTADAQLPVSNAPFAVASKPRAVPETSRGFTPDVVAPFVVALSLPQDRPRLVADGSVGSSPLVLDSAVVVVAPVADRGQTPAGKSKKKRRKIVLEPAAPPVIVVAQPVKPAPKPVPPIVAAPLVIAATDSADAIKQAAQELGALLTPQDAEDALAALRQALEDDDEEVLLLIYG